MQYFVHTCSIAKNIMTSHFYNGVQKCFFEILSTLVHYSSSGIDLRKIGFNSFLNSFSFQNPKTELRNLSSLRRYSSAKLHVYFTIFRNL